VHFRREGSSDFTTELKPGFEVFPDTLVKYFPFPTVFPNSP